jgi:hypothetical protein
MRALPRCWGVQLVVAVFPAAWPEWVCIAGRA